MSEKPAIYRVRRRAREKDARVGSFRGKDAEERYRTLPWPRHELMALCRGPNEQARHLFGFAGDLAFHFCTHDDGALHLEARGREDAKRLFGALLEGLEGRRGMVNSDPRSPDFFRVEPEIEDLAEMIPKELGVEFG